MATLLIKLKNDFQSFKAGSTITATEAAIAQHKLKNGEHYTARGTLAIAVKPDLQTAEEAKAAADDAKKAEEARKAEEAKKTASALKAPASTSGGGK